MLEMNRRGGVLLDCGAGVLHDCHCGGGETAGLELRKDSGVVALSSSVFSRSVGHKTFLCITKHLPKNTKLRRVRTLLTRRIENWQQMSSKFQCNE